MEIPEAATADFFESQERARTRTGRLVAFFALAVLAIGVAVYFALVAALLVVGASNPTGPASGARASYASAWWDPGLAGLAAVLVAIVVGSGSAWRIAQLRRGGRAVAQQLGGRLVDPGSLDLRERKLLNVVDEMAIASGTPVPAVYVLPEERGINAFAAGHEPADAAVAVTRGGLEKLTRDELQGVVAHEFSHILNGDMRLNLRLLGVVHGIVVLGILGRLLIRATGRRRSGRSDGRAQSAAFVLGAGLFAIGSLGSFFGHCIRAAVSRQREFLADSAAVQFTRHPEGIADALRKIGGLSHGSLLQAPDAREVSHMLFGAGFRSAFGRMLATHPPLDERIRRIDPFFDGRFPRIAEDYQAPVPGAVEALVSAAVETGGPPRVGRPSEAHLSYARQLLAAIPPVLVQAAEHAFGARALVYAMLLDPEPAVRARQRARLEESADPLVLAELEGLLEPVRSLDPRGRLPLFDLALPALGELSPDQYRAFDANLDALVRADDQVAIFEWVLHLLVRKHLGPQFQRMRRKARQRAQLADLAPHVGVLIATLGRVGSPRPEDARAAIAAAMRRLPPAVPEPRRLDPSLEELRVALLDLDGLAPLAKRDLLSACATAISHDRIITLEEGELYRAVADALGCPVPPLLPGQTLVDA